jgi:hypothetical protein
MWKNLCEQITWCVTSGSHREVDENRAYLGYYEASNGNSLPMFWDNLSLPSSRVKKMWSTCYPQTSSRDNQHSLRNDPEERGSQFFPLWGTKYYCITHVNSKASCKPRHVYKSFFHVLRIVSKIQCFLHAAWNGGKRLADQQRPMVHNLKINFSLLCRKELDTSFETIKDQCKSEFPYVEEQVNSKWIYRMFNLKVDLF